MEEFIELIKNGADFNFCDENGITPLMKASLNHNPTLLRLIIKHSNQINHKDKFNNTALYYATQENHLENVKILHQYGGKISDEIYMLALHNNFKEIVKYFDQQDPIKSILIK